MDLKKADCNQNLVAEEPEKKAISARKFKSH
jgi:hypothetical protein